jgi:hypothetical protein
LLLLEEIYFGGADMLTRRTTFVLGAGASVPFGFPTGLQLSKEMVENLSPNGRVSNDLIRHCGFTEAEILDFKLAFFYSGKNSVDAFLEHRTEFMKIGKAAMASVLIRYEIPEDLFRYENNWLRYLYDRMNTSFKDFAKNKLSIITFNYDRTVENFFYTSLFNTYAKLRDNDYIIALSHVPIIHLHGRLGQLKYQGPHSRGYSPLVNDETMNLATENIKIIHEVNDDFSRAKKILMEAEQIYFLGFGYNPKNMERLEVSSIPSNIAKGTALGMTAHEWSTVATLSGGKIERVEGDCMECLRSHVKWN